MAGKATDTIGTGVSYNKHIQRYCSNYRDSPGHTEVYVETKHERSVLPLRRDVVNHSNGFSWGYGGSGPAQLAAAILAEHVGEEAAREWYQEFKYEVISRRDPDRPLSIPSSVIDGFLEERGWVAV